MRKRWHLRSPFVLQATRTQPNVLAGGCQTGYIAPSGSLGPCYRKIGTPVTITSAAISPVSSFQPNSPSGQQAGPAQDEFMITLPAADQAALTAVTTAAANARGPLTLSVAGRTWVLGIVLRPFPGRQLQISLPSRNQVLQLQRILASSG